MSRHAGIFATAAAAIMLLAGDAAIIYGAGDAIARQLGARPVFAAWFPPLGHAVALAALFVCGRLADDWGRRRLFLGGLAAYTLGAALPFALPNAAGVVAARVLQGLGAAAVLTAGPALVVAACPPYLRGGVLGGLVSAAGAGILAVLALTDGFLLAYRWQALFALLAAWGALCLLGAVLLLPDEEPPGQRRPFDPQGAFLSAFALANLFYAVYLTGYDGRAGALQSVLAFAGLVGLAWFVRVERETPAPLLELSLLSNGRLAGALVAGFFGCAMLAASATGLALFLSGARQAEWPALLAAGAMVPAAMIAAAPFAGALADKRGSRGPCVAGLGTLAVALLWLQLSQAAPPWVLGAQLAVLGGGFALFQAPNDSAVLGSVPPRALGMGAALLSASRIAGVAVGAALARVLFLTRFEAESGYAWGQFAPGSGGGLESGVEAAAIALRLVLQAAATLGAPAVLASLMKSRGATHEPPTLF